jgi:nucleotide-binding universal stress UspA family protein
MLKILVPVDFSPESENALLYAIKIAKSTDKASIILHHSIFVKDVMADLLEKIKDVLIAETEKELAALLKKCNSKGIENVDFKTDYVFGYPDESILQVAEKYHSNIIIMGTKGASGIERFLIGSVATKVLENATIPVLVVPKDYSPRNKIKEILFSSDLEKLDTRLHLVVAFAKLFDAQVSVLHILPESASQIVLNSEETANRLITKNNYEKIKFFTFMDSNIEQGIHNFVSQHPVDLLVMHPQKRSFIEKILDISKTKNLVSNSLTPILAVPIKD